MENPISQNEYEIIVKYDGSNETKKRINENAQNGKSTIIIGNLTDLTIASTSEKCVDNNIRSYVGSLNAYAKKSGLIYVPGERDLHLYTELKDIIDGCKNRSDISTITSWQYCSEILKIAERIIKERPDLTNIYKELASLAMREKNDFLYVLKSLMVLGKQPIYVIRQDIDGKYLLISHANPAGRAISESDAKLLSAKSETIEKVAGKHLQLIRSSSIGSTHKKLKNAINNDLNNYLLDPHDPIRFQLNAEEWLDR